MENPYKNGNANYKKRKMQITKMRKRKNALNKGSFFFFLFYMKKIENVLALRNR